MNEHRDREFLELAAKVYGAAQEPETGEWERFFERVTTAAGDEEFREWNPLEDDGDALRLGVNLKLTIFQSDLFVRVGDAIEPFASESLRGEAMRRAIVRAAAAMAEGGE